MMRDSSDEEISNYFDNDDQEKEQIRRQNTLEVWRWKAKAACLLYLLLKRRRRRLSANNLRPAGKLWTRFHNSEPEREKHSLYTTILLAEKSLADGFTFRNITRMSPTLFNKLLCMVGPSLFKKDTNMRRSIPVGKIRILEIIKLQMLSNYSINKTEQRLALTLRFLASGDCMRSLSYSFRIGHSTVSEIVNETCRIMYEILDPTYLQLPDTNMWKLISNYFSKIWNFTNCVGAGDGKHFAMQCPNNGGSNWYNYKGFHSMVMFAVCDANYCFIAVDIGAYGREGDASIFASSQFSKYLDNGCLGIPGPSKLVCLFPRMMHFH
ncbi:protein ANTAGONIST OF LIKE HETEROCHROMATIN PROTEIN 1-like isoform X4 [Daphnia magna]|uniref:protein ANTAGONIST OF LIKE HETEROCHROMATIN PROTEIN 1-like isoform X4 n=1 Tax=Daphnia magna TaxID=35525 RepID=UPI001E1BC3C8|nr:protein ANTAGONIST OF LIKE HETEROCHROMATIN PROTEIN 1-like isoform X4 [Daphnia magna]